MEQYEKSGPKVDLSVHKDKDDAQKQIANLEDKVLQQGKEIELLKRELRRIASRLDQSAAVVNKLTSAK